MPTTGTGYQTASGRYADTMAITLLAAQAFGAQVIGEAIEIGERKTLRLTLEVTAKSGTNPTLDVSILTSKDGKTAWRSVGSFAQKSNVGKAMGAVTSAGTTPPVITLSGTIDRAIDLRIECTTLGALATSVIRYSIDGGVTWTSGVTTAASIDVLDASDGNADTGLNILIAAGTAATDNVWTAKTVGYEEKCFSGCDRFVKAVAQVGGTATPLVTASVTGEAA